MKFEHLPSVNLAWHDPKLQHSSSDIVGIEELFRLNVVCPLRIPPSRIVHYHLECVPPGSRGKHQEKKENCTASDNVTCPTCNTWGTFKLDLNGQ